MLRSVKQMYGDALGAFDGEFGHVKDLYFDDRSWAVRYVVADTGTWLSGRQVLLAPYCLDRLDESGSVLEVKLTKEQIENSPSIETHKPVSRKYEEDYYRYFGWPFYWQGDALWGVNASPVMDAANELVSIDSEVVPAPSGAVADSHLRSTKEVRGYHVQASDGMVGHVVDFMMDDWSWAIGEITVKTGYLFSGRRVQIPIKHVDHISYEASTIYLNLPISCVEEDTLAQVLEEHAAE